MPNRFPFLGFIRLLLALVAAALLLPADALAQGNVIRNTATLRVPAPGGDVTIASNTVETTVGRYKTKITFHRLPQGWNPDYSMTRCELLPRPTYRPIALTEALYAQAEPLKSLDIDNPYVMALDAPGENHDPNTIEKTFVTASSGVRELDLQLTETGPNTGVFAGMIPASGRATGTPDTGCDIGQDHSGWITVRFAGDEDDDSATNSLLIDPQGHVFDSKTGVALNGATVTVIDAATGKPAATVFADDGVSAYPNTVVSGQNVTDSGGYVHHMDLGDFRFPLLPPGDYRLVVTPPPGYTFASTAPAKDLAGFRNPHGNPYTIAAGSYGGVFTLSDPYPVTIDVPVDPIAKVTEAVTPRLVLDKTASERDASAGDFIQYRLELKNAGDGAATPVTVRDVLPRGFRYRTGSTQGVAEPLVARDGRTITFTVPNLAVGAAVRVSYVAEVGPGTPAGEAVNSASATAPGAATSNIATASVRISAPLFTDAFTIIGRVTEGGCGDPGRNRKGIAGIRLLMEDGTWIVTDQDGLYHFEGASPGTHVVQIDTASIPASYAPVVCDRDTRTAGSGISRFVEGSGGSLQRIDFQLRPTGVQAAAADALPIAPAADALAAGNGPDWLAQATPGTGWLFPGADHNPRAPALRVVIRHAPGQRVALTLNGKPVDVLSFDGSDEDKDRGVAISRWTGLPLVDGDNVLQARILDGDQVVATLDRTVHYANLPAQAVFDPEHSRLVADGLTRPLLAVRVTDRFGKPVRAGSLVPFRVDQPYRAAQAVAAEQGRQLAGMERTQTVAQVVGDDGIAFLALEPTRNSGMARVTVTFSDHDQRDRAIDLKAWLAAPAQDWVVVGFGKGTIGYDKLSGAEALAKGKDGEIVTDGQLSLYAKGRIKGSWLLTLAYDSAKNRERMRERGLLGAIDPDRYYTVYGDGTAQGYDASSQRKLYLRLERRAFQAMFGDFETGFVDTKLGRYSRTMNGVKAEYSGNTIQFSAFAANDDSRYGRDEIQGNGLSGPYRLSAHDIVPNSDKITLETRDRYRSELIVDSRQLTRNIDYDIDPVAGTLRFKEPVLSRDSDLNPVFIVADYETYGDSNKLAAGARASVKLGKAELGATVLRDESVGSGNGTLAAVDAKVKLSSTTEIRAEAAMGGRTGIRNGTAFLVEAEHHGSAADVLAYARQQDRDFGLGQQNSGESGTRKIGFDGRLKVSERWYVTASGWYQQDLTGDASRLAGDLRVEHRRESGILYAGARYASDSGTAGGERNQSLLLLLGGSQKLFRNRLELSAESQLPVGGKNDSVDFPAKQSFGAAWRFNDWLRLVSNFEYAKGDDYTAQNARVGFDIAPWGGARLLATMNQGEIGENGTRTFAQYGLSQSLPIGKRWTIDATIDSASTVSGRIPDADIVNRLHPVASGATSGGTGLDGDFIAVTLGANYRGDRWSWNGRAEYRGGSRDERWGLTSNLLRTLGEGKTLASSIRAYRLKETTGAVTTSINADIALALRPLDSRWSLLERFQLRSEAADGNASAGNALAVPVFASGTQTTMRAINNVALNYRTGDEGDGHGLETSVYYGAKYVRGRYADEKVAGFIDVAGVEIRKDISTHFDLGAGGSVRHSWTGGALQYSLGVSAGVSPAKNLWVTAGYNATGYRDRDFEEARWTRAGPYVTVRMKFDQGSIRDMMRPIFGGSR